MIGERVSSLLWQVIFNHAQSHILFLASKLAIILRDFRRRATSLIERRKSSHYSPSAPLNRTAMTVPSCPFRRPASTVGTGIAGRWKYYAPGSLFYSAHQPSSGPDDARAIGAAVWPACIYPA